MYFKVNYHKQNLNNNREISLYNHENLKKFLEEHVYIIPSYKFWINVNSMATATLSNYRTPEHVDSFVPVG